MIRIDMGYWKTIDKPIQVTVWSDVKEIINSQYGKITYYEYCCKEAERVNKRYNANAFVALKNSNSECCLSRKTRDVFVDE